MREKIKNTGGMIDWDDYYDTESDGEYEDEDGECVCRLKRITL